MENNEIITLRDKEQYETQSEYIEYIRRDVISKANNIISNKDSEIAELRAQVANKETEISSLKANMANKEKSQIDSVLTKTEIDLRAIVNELVEIVNNNKDVHDRRLDELIGKVDDAIVKYTDISSEYEKVNKELSKPVNFDNIQDVIKTQKRLEKIVQKIYDEVKQGKEEIVDRINDINVETKTNVSGINSMEQAVNLVSDVPIESNYQAPVISAFDNSTEEKVEEGQSAANNYEEEVKQDLDNEVSSQTFVNPFDQALNPTEEVNSESNNGENISQEVVAPVTEGIPNVFNSVPVNEEVVSTEETIAPAQSVIDSIVPNNDVNETNTNDDNVIKEMPQEDQQILIDQVNQNQNSNEVKEEENNLDDAQKVTNVEEIPQEQQQILLEQAKNSLDNTKDLLKGTAIKVRRGFVNKIKGQNKDDVITIKSNSVDEVNLSPELQEYFNTNLNFQPIVMTR